LIPYRRLLVKSSVAAVFLLVDEADDSGMVLPADEVRAGGECRVATAGHPPWMLIANPVLNRMSGGIGGS
jgi:hypothetical protein